MEVDDYDSGSALPYAGHDGGAHRLAIAGAVLGHVGQEVDSVGR